MQNKKLIYHCEYKDIIIDIYKYELFQLFELEFETYSKTNIFDNITIDKSLKIIDKIEKRETLSACKNTYVNILNVKYTIDNTHLSPAKFFEF